MTETTSATANERACAYRVLRYTPNLVRDEWVNIGVLVFNPQTGERRLRMIEEPEEYARVRRLHPHADEGLLRALRDDLENRFATATTIICRQRPRAKETRAGGLVETCWASGTIRSPMHSNWPRKRASCAGDLDAETERLYADHVAPRRARATRVGAAGHPRCDPFLLRAGPETGAPVGTHAKGRARGGVHLSRRSHAPRLRLPPQRHARLRAGAQRLPRAGRRQASGLHRRAHSRKGEIQRNSPPSPTCTCWRKTSATASSRKLCAMRAWTPCPWKVSRCGPRRCAR